MRKLFFKSLFAIAFIPAAVLFICSCGAKKENPGNSDITGVFAAARIPLLKQTVSARDFSLPQLLSTGEPVGETVTLSNLKGSVVFLNFWATWCPPCRDEMPSMESLYGKFKGRSFEMLAVNCGEGDAVVSAFRDDNNFSFPILLDSDGAVNSRYGIQAIPATFIIDKEGRIVVRFVGSTNWDTPEIHKAMEMLLDSW